MNPRLCLCLCLCACPRVSFAVCCCCACISAIVCDTVCASVRAGVCLYMCWASLDPAERRLRKICAPAPGPVLCVLLLPPPLGRPVPLQFFPTYRTFDATDIKGFTLLISVRNDQRPLYQLCLVRSNGNLVTMETAPSYVCRFVVVVALHAYKVHVE